MGLLEEHNLNIEAKNIKLTNSKKRRIRRKKLHASIYSKSILFKQNNIVINSTNYSIKSDTTNLENSVQESGYIQKYSESLKNIQCIDIQTPNSDSNKSSITQTIMMSSKENSEKSREDVKAAREAKKLAKQKAKKKLNESTDIFSKDSVSKSKDEINSEHITIKPIENKSTETKTDKNKLAKSKDEVDKAIVNVNSDVSLKASKEVVIADRAARKATKQAKKKGEETEKPASDMSVTDMVNTLKDIVIVAKEMQAVTARVEAIDLGSKKSEETNKSKAELRAERRAKQEAQRAAKQAAQLEKAPPKQDVPKEDKKENEEKVPKIKVTEKVKTKAQSVQKINWFHHLQADHDVEESLKKIPINSNLHPAVVRLGVQLATRVIVGSNARCIALLDALKQVVRDYVLPARTEFGRGLEAALSRCATFLWRLRAPGAAQLNALAMLRRHLTHLPADAHEFDAKKKLQEEIDRYIREQIDMAGEAISIAVRNKISDGDNILTYGCSSLIERILVEAHSAGKRFRAVVTGSRVQRGGRELLRRLVASGLACTYCDITALNFLMGDVSKVLLGAESLLANGSVVGAAGSLSVALAARACNVPVLVACETHKFSERARADAFLADDLGNPDDLIDKNDENSPVKDWRLNPNLTLLNLTYDITPPSLVTAVVTELAILPCTSAPVVLRYKLSEYGI